MEDKIIKQFYDLRKEVVYDTREFEVKMLQQMYDNNKLYLGLPTGSTLEYSRIIERVLLGYPTERINVILSTTYPHLSILRTNSIEIRALLSFTSNGFKLYGLKYLTEINNLYFNELPDNIRNTIQNYWVRAIVASEGFSERYFNFN